MVEVTKNNFKGLYADIENNIRRCDFIAIDTEFTGLRLNEQVKGSLFDDAAERYIKLKQTISKITFCQFGLSLFIKDQKENRYDAFTYNFYIYPRSFGPIDQNFVCQASSLEFLCRYKFDFNKFVYEGVGHMNEDQYLVVREHLTNKSMFTGLERDLDEKAVQVVCSNVAEWFISCEEGATMTISKEDMQGVRAFVLSMELRARFPAIWTTVSSEDKTITVEKISLDRREELEKSTASKQKEQEEELLNKVLGFTRVVRVMKECKKPMIGHNMLMDLMLLYDKCHRPLPATYKKFKEDIHVQFPCIYDTKHMAMSLGKTLESSGLISRSFLSGLYEAFLSDKGRDLVLHSPTITHAEGFDNYKSEKDNLPHEAGFDAFMCGFVYLRLAHFITFKDIKSSSVIPCLFRRYIQSTEDYRNKINLIRANVDHLSLEGPEPKSRRPELLYVRARMFKQKLDLDQLAKWFSPYGSVDIKPYGSSKALVAAGNKYCATDIMRAFKSNKTIYVARYSVWRHKPLIRGILWSGVVLSSGLCVWLAFHDRKS